MSIDIPSSPHEIKAKLFPKVYLMVERVLKYVKENNGNVKTALCSIVPEEFVDRVYSLTYNVMEHKEIIAAILKDTKLLEKVPLRQEAVEIMIYEMAIRKSSLPGESDGVLIMRKYKTEIEESLSKVRDTSVANASHTYCSLPLSAMINVRAISVDDALADMENNGYERIHYRSDISLKDYQALVLDLQKKQFIVDYHFKDLLVFSPDENLFELTMYRNRRQLFWQNKSVYVPVHVLSPEPGSVVMAATSKMTAHMVSVMENNGTIYAISNNANRCKDIQRLMDASGSTISQVLCKNFMDVNPNAHPCHSVEYILLEPECSKSGLAKRNSEFLDRIDAVSKKQLYELAQCQIRLLKHALSFPQVKRVVYTTCSSTEEENEFVVSEVLKQYSYKFRLIPAMPEWPTRGLQGCEHKDMFFRATPQENLINVVFVAVFERVVATEDVGGIRDASCEAYAPEGANEELVKDQPKLKKRKMMKKNCLSKSTGKVSGRLTGIVKKIKKVKGA